MLVSFCTNGVLHLVDLKNNEIVELYKILLKETEQEYIEYEDCPIIMIISGIRIERKYTIF